ncbi:sugar phosphate isomerase/epimerase family protein [Actinomyces ruminicola]|uniref:Xylose isomerase-like TIM barrel n=1 Tax=Actinomyces ruminicola TaxID=332524 RepID=A0A1G9V650_9ACTO|nr:TIM barrel protein [Actinomyces ruminicola]SDM67654.1 Xylose isomerase-like TIM barrel [Actinomyces ruminicola]
MTIKKGVSLYSLQDAYGRGGLGLEGTVAAVEDMGTQGIEILSDEMIRGAARASEETLAEWDAIMERHPLQRVSNDIFINSSLYKNRWLTLEEQVELLSADLRLTHRLGFPLVRIVSQTDPAVIRPTLPLAEKLGITMAVEVHAGMSYDHPMTAAWIKEMKEVDNPHVGLVVDFGIYCQRHPRVSTNYFRETLGVNEDVIKYIDDIFARGTDPRQFFPRNPDNPDDYVFPEELSRHFRTFQDRFYAMMSTGYENTPLDTLDEYLPYIKSFHGKFWEVTDSGEEYSIDYGRIFTRLNQLGFDGYVCSEYEGQRFTLPGEEIKDLEQVRRHQEFMERHLNDGKNDGADAARNDGK